MNTPVDLTNLRSMTDGDKEMEKALFEEFFSSFKAGVAILQSSLENTEAWRKEAHALKGVALNLGAMELGELCKKGQDEPNADAAAKESLLKTIQSEYERVERFLSTIN